MRKSNVWALNSERTGFCWISWYNFTICSEKHVFPPKGDLYWTYCSTASWACWKGGSVHLTVNVYNVVGGLPCQGRTVNNFPILIFVFMSYLFNQLVMTFEMLLHVSVFFLYIIKLSNCHLLLVLFMHLPVSWANICQFKKVKILSVVTLHWYTEVQASTPQLHTQHHPVPTLWAWTFTLTLQEIMCFWSKKNLFFQTQCMALVCFCDLRYNGRDGDKWLNNSERHAREDVL